MTFDPVKVGTRWALVWDEEEQDFFLERPELDGDSDTPEHGKYLAALQRLSGDGEFVSKIMDFIDADIARWKKEHGA